MNITKELTDSLISIPMSKNYKEFEQEYELSETIGEGGFGKVKKAIQRCDGKKVAIKFINQSKISTWHYDEIRDIYVPMEIALLCHCRQIDGVIKVLKYFHIEERKGWFIVMERFDEYIDLFDHITNLGQIDEPTAADFFQQLHQILINCRLLGVCHRDIKDENIVINLKTMKIYLIDFGAGGILHEEFYNEFDGTRVYSPPEWIQHKRYQVDSLETWSLGILLYDMVCGNLPFDNDDSITNSQLQFRRPISRHCQDLISQCLQKTPESRILFQSIINHRWFSRSLRNSSRIHTTENTLSLCNSNSIKRDHTSYTNDSNNNIITESMEVCPTTTKLCYYSQTHYKYNHSFNPFSHNCIYPPTSIMTSSSSYSCSSSASSTSSLNRRISVDTSPISTPQSSGIDEFQKPQISTKPSRNLCPHSLYNSHTPDHNNNNNNHYHHTDSFDDYSNKLLINPINSLY